MNEILNVKGLSAGYGPLRVIHDLDLIVNAGERVQTAGRTRVTAAPRTASPSLSFHTQV